MNVSCQQCGCEFKVRPSFVNQGRKYCSRKCFGESRKTRVECECQQCGECFEVRPSRVKQGRKYCSKACYDATQRTQVERECEQCGEIFEVKPAEVKRGYGKYCSRKCFGESQRNRVERECEQCGECFEVPSSHARAGRKYCSQDCWREAKHNPYSDRAERIRKRSIHWRATVRKQYGYGTPRECCAECGKRGRRTMTVDHIKPLSVMMEERGMFSCDDETFERLWRKHRAAFLDPANGRLLCLNCNSAKHASWERGQGVLL